MGVEQLTAIADRGYYKNTEILACDNAGIKVVIAKSVTSTAIAERRFGKDDFIYDAKTMCIAAQQIRYSSDGRVTRSAAKRNIDIGQMNVKIVH